MWSNHDKTSLASGWVMVKIWGRLDPAHRCCQHTVKSISFSAGEQVKIKTHTWVSHGGIFGFSCRQKSDVTFLRTRAVRAKVRG